jgi:hypothetical protein
VTTPPAKAGGFLQTASAFTAALRHTPASTTATFTAAGPVRALRHAVSVVSLLCGTTFTNDPLSFNPAKSYLKEPQRLSFSARSD